jgi:superfamily I DNA/RNA helicase
LLLAYNARLKKETRKKCEDLNLENLAVHSFHSAVRCMYGAKDTDTDTGLLRVLREGVRPVQPVAFDIVIVDECQDVTPLLYRIVCRKLLSDNSKGRATRLVVLGDLRQTINEARSPSIMI